MSPKFLMIFFVIFEMTKDWFHCWYPFIIKLKAFFLLLRRIFLPVIWLIMKKNEILAYVDFLFINGLSSSLNRLDRIESSNYMLIQRRISHEFRLDKHAKNWPLWVKGLWFDLEWHHEWQSMKGNDKVRSSRM